MGRVIGCAVAGVAWVAFCAGWVGFNIGRDAQWERSEFACQDLLANKLAETLVQSHEACSEDLLLAAKACHSFYADCHCPTHPAGGEHFPVDRRPPLKLKILKKKDPWHVEN